ncbi:lysine 2,3-aminomutase [Mycobacterium sp. CBMA293]|uniref:KamA family radical SAM protein n=1 Tax=unclassified Mycolicibacterium TaxID=2636767 RepID=UPI0012DC8BB3|nr:MULTISPECIES: lysine 2,3-aminomutase [unclassified Mycolicibacterium]MUL46249.1 lysine 2,3-aminomutase [Mycolicibacterium sp. CBMA 360]MUL58700.1 lysine 2,3-aminomutase [Mycolicibacterium sp. CBMA 335]MUL69094.1 lysine 2,3-aminomutase [Mycolicibacterium sp. CBMA 311]MUL97252.1 lysine 2,3-aminomutase [Mycolicibacterium sp. CBMA 230]MUM05070.1 lysine 2,3-aminomutase [Mycolicibacterium sp. CBMA 213]
MRLVAEPTDIGFAAAADQPYSYVRQPLSEPDWRRYPGWATVTDAQWRDPQWQRAHSIKNVKQLYAVTGDLLDDLFYEDLVVDQQQRATMSMLLPPQMLNTMAPHCVPDHHGLTAAFYTDPIRRYMLPVLSDRDPAWCSHPFAERDSLHESDMWVVEGLTHRYPTKVLAELLATCPQYCGHCTRMDLVGNSTPTVAKSRLSLQPVDRQTRILEYLRGTPAVRDVVVSGGDVANVPWPRLEAFVTQLLAIDTIRDIRLATKALAALPQHWLQPKVVEGVSRLAQLAASRGVNLALHTHINHVQSVTPLVAAAARALLDAGLRDVRNQGVLMRGVNATAGDLLDLCFALQGEANILPYYFYMCDMIPNAEHWRTALWEAQELQLAIMGYLPGFATPRIVCDVPYVGKRWVHQVVRYDRTRGISYWNKNYRTGLDSSEVDVSSDVYPFYDPIGSLPASGQEWWRRSCQHSCGTAVSAAGMGGVEGIAAALASNTGPVWR